MRWSGPKSVETIDKVVDGLGALLLDPDPGCDALVGQRFGLTLVFVVVTVVA